MLEWFLFVGLPYVAIVSFVAVSLLRFYLYRYSISSLSSQILEDRWLGTGSLPWHLGILVVFAGHVLAFLAPGVWRSILSHPAVLHTVEIIGIAAATACAFGLVTLLLRRILRGRLQKVTSWVDYVVLLLLLFEVIFGILVAVVHPWGALWSTGTVMPFARSLLSFSPNMELVTDLPALAKTHIVAAFVIMGLMPFTRLIHAIFVPLEYLYRAPQKVVWTSSRKRESIEAEPGGDPDIARRQLIEGVVGASAAAALLGVGVADKAAKYFAQPNLTPETKTQLLSERHLRVTMTAEERALELERLSNDAILVSAYADLSNTSGKYFIDYEMRPALAFMGADGSPTLLSAKCTHLGCTVGKDVDEKGRILCPCHVSYFDVSSGIPQAGAPAKAPLRKLPWTIKDTSGKVVASMGADGRYEGSRDRELLAMCNVYVVKSTRGEAT